MVEINARSEQDYRATSKRRRGRIARRIGGRRRRKRRRGRRERRTRLVFSLVTWNFELQRSA